MSKQGIRKNIVRKVAGKSQYNIKDTEYNRRKDLSLLDSEAT
ncbi:MULTISPECIES: hypothetical protein [unclassified Clostridium]